MTSTPAAPSVRASRLGASAARLCELLGIARPVLLAPMAKVAGGELAAAVSNAGGLGILGGGYGDADWLAEQAAVAGSARVGIGVITWNMADGGLDTILSHQPCAVWLAFGDLVPHIAPIQAAGAKVICQVGTAEEAIEAVDAGADVIVAQGTESGGHGRPQFGLHETLAQISDALPDIPLVAAGGINTQQDLDAAHIYGAAGAALGTAFYATHEALEVNEAKARLVEVAGADTIRSRVYDHIRGPVWPEGYSGRTAQTTLTSAWAGREDELALDVAPHQAAHADAVVARDMDVRVLWAGEGVGGVTEIVDALVVVERFDSI